MYLARKILKALISFRLSLEFDIKIFIPSRYFSNPKIEELNSLPYLKEKEIPGDSAQYNVQFSYTLE
jgi:hypothetical protein